MVVNATNGGCFLLLSKKIHPLSEFQGRILLLDLKSS